MEARIAVQNIRKSFGHLCAVKGVSFTVNKGEVLGFLGCNGAGKTTTMRMLAGYLTPDAGTITICGKSFGKDDRDIRRHVGYLPEGAPLYGDMKTRDMLSFMAAMLQLEPSEKKERMDYVIHALHLQPVLDQVIETLSKGYRRRVALALTLLHDPEVLILDEPTDGLDPNQKWEVLKLIHDMTREKAIILSTHMLEEAETLCRRAVIIDAGQIIASGTLPDLIMRTGNAASLSEAFRIITHMDRREVYT